MKISIVLLIAILLTGTGFGATCTEQTENSIRYMVIAVTRDSASHKDFMDIVREDGSWKVSRF
jgi:hypothetical protein